MLFKNLKLHNFYRLFFSFSPNTYFYCGLTLPKCMTFEENQNISNEIAKSLTNEKCICNKILYLPRLLHRFNLKVKYKSWNK